MSGLVPLGYEVNERRLIVNQSEAETVREIFRRYLELGSVRLLMEELNRRGIRSKVRVARNGKNSQTAGDFLAKLRSSGNVTASADSAGVGVATIYERETIAASGIGTPLTRYRIRMPGRPSKLNSQTAGDFLAKLRSSGNVTASADSAGVGVATIYHWLELGRQRKSGAFREFLEAFGRARGDYRLYRAIRQHDIAIGGIEKKPATNAGTTLIKRDENGEVVWEEHWREPNVRALEWEMERDEPDIYGRRSDTAPPSNISDQAPKSRAELEAEAGMYLDLFAGGVKILLDLGVPLPQIAGMRPPEPTVVEATIGKGVEQAESES